MQGVSESESILTREMTESEPITDYHSKMVMLRAERHDTLAFPEVITWIQHASDIPTEATVVRRTTSYFGPKLLLEVESRNYLLTAPGPDTYLLLWYPQTNDQGEKCGWQKFAEVKATFADDTPQYDLCPECGNPMQTLEHERQAAVGHCLVSDL